MRVNKDTTWGDLEPDLSFLDHPAFPDSTKRPENQGGDIEGGDIDEPSYTDVIYEKYMSAVGELNVLKKTIELQHTEIQDLRHKVRVLEDREIKRDVEQYRRNLKLWKSDDLKS